MTAFLSYYVQIVHHFRPVQTKKHDCQFMGPQKLSIFSDNVRIKFCRCKNSYSPPQNSSTDSSSLELIILWRFCQEPITTNFLSCTAKIQSAKVLLLECRMMYCVTLILVTIAGKLFVHLSNSRSVTRIPAQSPPITTAPNLLLL